MNRLLTIVDSKYKRLEYLESTGTQYIDTGVMADDTTGLNIEVQSLLSSDRILIGSRVAGTDSRFYIGTTANYYIGWNVYNTTEIPYSQKSQISLNFYNDRSVYGDGVFKRYVSGTLATQNSNIIIFGMNSSNNPASLCSCKMYKVQISKGNSLVRNFVPVLRKTDNELGMLDLVEGKFYGNAGTGKFTANLDTMYAIIQGSPTQSPYGVFSGFSASNYLKLINASNLNNKNFEIVTKFKLTSVSGWQIIQKLWDNSYQGGLAVQAGKIKWYIKSSSVSEGLTCNTTINTNTWYYAKQVQDGLNLSISMSTDGVNWFDTKTTILSESLSYIQQVLYGTNQGYGNSNLTLDLNRSYIKIDNTKFKLQAVVGYTVVGSPTITDGVVSGFSNANYLSLTNLPADTQKFEIVVCFKSNSTDTPIIATNSLGFIIRQGDNQARVFLASTTSSGWDISNDKRLTALNNAKNWIKIEFTGTQYILSSSNDGINYTIEHTINNSSSIYGLLNSPIRIGQMFLNNQYYVGEIYINNTYIKINNKLWFNGQQA